MEPVLLLFGAAASLAGVAIRSLAVARERKERTRAWQAALRASNLEDVREDAGRSGAVSGFLGKHQVFLEEHSAGEGEIAVRIVIQGDSELTVGRQTLRGALEADLGAREIETGDVAFDQEFCVRGSPGVARALLDAKARERLTPLLRGWIRLDGVPTLGVEATVSLQDGDLEANLRPQWVDSLRTNLPAVLAALLAVARSLEEAAARENTDGRLRRAVRQSIAEIQSRLEGASPGQLSLAAVEGGTLSLAEEDSSGQVSLPETDHER